ncbi:hypothetical protein PIB30_020591 [Stylosanthes scabra]|uniref:Uncharacterized protein n=1 Tax=Stylosanthes scabra TaxID=79078 RepID=A0ABU6R8V4_9FABA|nr:hypothetical protein [Stylosanthes scabra]
MSTLATGNQDPPTSDVIAASSLQRCKPRRSPSISVPRLPAVSIAHRRTSLSARVSTFLLHRRFLLFPASSPPEIQRREPPTTVSVIYRGGCGPRWPVTSACSLFLTTALVGAYVVSLAPCSVHRRFLLFPDIGSPP